MKSYTDLEQSKKLVEILPIESADMSFVEKGNAKRTWYDAENRRITTAYEKKYYIPCWSLAALLDVLESEIDGEEGETYELNIEKDGTWWNIWYRERYDEASPVETESTEELIDACCEMILKLHGQNLL